MSRPIVFSGRFYYPPDNRRLSRYHLYRCNTDGSRRLQLTSDRVSDYRPLWSPDGEHIFFQRVEKPRIDSLSLGVRLKTYLCIIRPDGSGFRELPLPFPHHHITEASWVDREHLWIHFTSHNWPSLSGDEHPGWFALMSRKTGRVIHKIASLSGEFHGLRSPSGKLVATNARIFELETGKMKWAAPKNEVTPWRSSLWETDDQLLQLTNHPKQSAYDDFTYSLERFTLSTGKRSRIATTRFNNYAWGHFLWRFASGSSSVWVEEYCKDKWYGRQFWKVELATGKATAFNLGWQPVFSSDNQHFITPGGREPTAYGARPNGAPRAVMTVPLLAGQMAHAASAKPLFPDLLEVDTCDWLPSTRDFKVL